MKPWVHRPTMLDLLQRYGANASTLHISAYRSVGRSVGWVWFWQGSSGWRTGNVPIWPNNQTRHTGSIGRYRMPIKSAVNSRSVERFPGLLRFKRKLTPLAVMKQEDSGWSPMCNELWSYSQLAAETAGGYLWTCWYAVVRGVDHCLRHAFEDMRVGDRNGYGKQ